MLYFQFHKAYGPWTLQGGELEWRNPIHKSRDTSTTWSRDKSKTLCLHFLKAYRSQTLQGRHPQSHVADQPGSHVTNQKYFIFTFTKCKAHKLSQVVARMNENEKTPPNMSCDTLIMLSRDNYPVVSSVHLFHF